MTTIEIIAQLVAVAIGCAAIAIAAWLQLRLRRHRDRRTRDIVNRIKEQEQCWQREHDAVW